jgi:hypothetical protein
MLVVKKGMPPGSSREPKKYAAHGVFQHVSIPDGFTTDFVQLSTFSHKH